MAEKCCGIFKLEKELEELTEKLKIVKQDFENLLKENLRKDLIIRRLKLRKNKNKFASFEKKLTKSCLDKLSICGDSQREDSQFVALVLGDLYGTEQIKKLSLSSRNRKTDKIVISEEKKSILQDIFFERLNKIPYVDNSRKLSLSKLIRNAVDNANRK